MAKPKQWFYVISAFGNDELGRSKHNSYSGLVEGAVTKKEVFDVALSEVRKSLGIDSVIVTLYHVEPNEI